MITVVNKHTHSPSAHDIYIGRGSALGNIFSHRTGTKALYQVNSVEDAIESYRGWLNKKIHDKNPAVMEALNKIKSLHLAGQVNLVCYCKPRPCHGDIIKNVIDNDL